MHSHVVVLDTGVPPVYDCVFVKIKYLFQRHSVRFNYLNCVGYSLLPYLAAAAAFLRAPGDIKYTK